MGARTRNPPGRVAAVLVTFEPVTEVRVRRVGLLSELHRYPLKSARGESLTEVAVGRGGLDQDRRWAATDVDGAVLSAQRAPGLRAVSASSDGGSLVVGSGQTDPVVALSSLLGRPVGLHDAGAGTETAAHQQVAAVHVVSLGAAAAADAPSGCDPDPRANLVLDLDHPGAERGWLGRELAVGEVRLRVTRTPSSCFGVYADVVAPGRVRVGDPVLLVGESEDRPGADGASGSEAPAARG